MPVRVAKVDTCYTHQVRADTLTPCQQQTSKSLKTACDFHQMIMIKHPHRSDFHSFAELLHAALLEGTPSVRSFTPQPFMLRINGKCYTPDAYISHHDGRREVVELKPHGEMDEALRIPLTHYFALHDMTFEVINNESVFDRQIEAENWLEIVRNLYLARDVDTQSEEIALLEHLTLYENCALGDLIDSGDRERTYPIEIACLRLLHRGRLTADLAPHMLDYDTRIRQCT